MVQFIRYKMPIVGIMKNCKVFEHFLELDNNFCADVYVCVSILGNSQWGELTGECKFHKLLLIPV